MRRINLLPWRTELREKKKKDYLTALGVSALVGLGFWMTTHFFFGTLIDHQNQRNSFLASEIKKLDRKIVEIKELEKEREKLIARMTAVEELQSSRHLAVRLFDELSRTLPDGVYLTELEQKNNEARIKGVAQSNARVSNFMRNLEASQWLYEPKLTIIETKLNEDKRTSEFTLHVRQKTDNTGDVQ